MATLAVIADDFTGCTDAEIQLFRFPASTVSLLPNAQVERYQPRNEVVIIDTEARFASPSAAYHVTRSIIQRLVQAGVHSVFKKLDSTFRGNIGSELDAAMDALGADFCAVVAAYPANGRTTRGGHHYVHGILISETEFARDPVHPVRDSFLVNLLRGQTRRPLGSIYLQAVRGGVEILASAMQREWERGGRILVIDAETDRDLEIIAGALARIDRLRLVAGSAAMLAAAYEKMHISGRRPKIPAGLPGPVLVISGSLHPVSAAQIGRLSDEMGAPVCALEVRRVLDAAARELETQRIFTEASGALAQGRPAVVSTHVNRIADEEAFQVTDILMTLLGELACQLRDRLCVQNFFLLGGRTALSVCTALGLEGVSVFREVEPGIALCRSIGGPADLRLAIKPGGFGSPDAVLTGVRMLSEGSPSHPIS